MTFNKGDGSVHFTKSTISMSDDDLLSALSEVLPLESASDGGLFNALPLELQLHIVDAVPVGERCDRAALALASPRLLAACRELPSCQGLEMSLAFHHVLGGAINEQLLRMYASRSKATPEGCEWLAGVDATAGVLVVSGTFGQIWHLKFGSDARYHALFKGARGGEVEAVSTLLGEGLLVNCVGPRGATPLHIAARYGQPQMVSLLIAQKADPMAKDERGNTPLEKARTSGSEEAFEIMRQLQAAMVPTPFYSRWRKLVEVTLFGQGRETDADRVIRIYG